VKRIIQVVLISFGLISLTALGAGAYLIKSSDLSKHQSAFTYEEITKINPALIIDRYTLVSEEIFSESTSRLVGIMVQNKVLIPTPFGMTINPEAPSVTLPVIIQSGGGFVSIGIQLSKTLNALREVGVKVHCYVAEAQSMAFYLMVTSCDKVIARRSVKLMQHKSAYGLAGYTPSTYLIDIEMARAESEALEINTNNWLELTRGDEDHIFNKEEIEKYGLVHEWVN